MSQDFMKSKLPPIYRRNNQDAYLDPIRQKLIYVTPEETIRQHVISFLIDELKVPKNMIRVEEPLKHYNIDDKGRVDIVINRYDDIDKIVYPIAVIECKAPGVLLGESAANQMFFYADNLNCDYCMMVNSDNYFCYKFENDTYIPIEKLPNYADMLGGNYKEILIDAPPPRLTFEEIKNKHILEYIESGDIGDSTPLELACPMVNFLECLLYINRKLPAKKYKIFRVIEDYGVRLLSYGNAAGLKFDNPYRSFLIEYKGNVEFVSISVTGYYNDNKPDVYKTTINVAIDNEKTSHHSLELSVDNNVEIYRDVLVFYHSGKIAIGNLGSGKIDELRNFIEKEYPYIIDGKRFNLGVLKHNRLWNLDDPEVMELVENLISYALIRDEYREYVKSHR